MCTPRLQATVVIALNLLATLPCGCATGRSFDATAPVDIRAGNWGSRYEQSGEQLDETDMLDKLSRIPATQHEANSAQNFRTVGILMGSAGGALVGWPIGEAIAGAEDPKWILAAIGAAVIVVGLPLDYQASVEARQAVKAHNLRLATRSEQTKPAAREADVQPPTVAPAASTPPPTPDTRPAQQAPSPPESPW